MKTYILRDPKAVEPQSGQTKPRRAAQGGKVAPTAPLPAPGPSLFIGLDVHNDSIAVSLATAEIAEVRRYGLIGGQQDDVLRLLKKLQAAHPGVALCCCDSALERQTR